MKARSLAAPTRTLHAHPRGRLLVLTGARQTGKTTLVKRVFDSYPYVSLEDPAARAALSGITAEAWYRQFPRAIVDEVQKYPSLVETIQAVYDEHADARYVLTGSSQILLLERTRESLAGRAALESLYPLTLPERASADWDESVPQSRLVRFLAERDVGLWEGIPSLDASTQARLPLWNDYLAFGAMPRLLDKEYTEDDRKAWLYDYHTTYLQRDLADLSRIADLTPFVKVQQSLAHMTGGLLNYSDLARTAGVSVDSARRFVRYMELSYQMILLQPWFRNAHKRLSKTPKVHFLDPGVCRGVGRFWGEPSGSFFESAVVSEIYRQVASSPIDAQFYHLRAQGGREVDLLIELENCFVAIEIKQTSRHAPKNFSGFTGLAELLDKPLLACLVLSNDPNVAFYQHNNFHAPVVWALG